MHDYPSYDYKRIPLYKDVTPEQWNDWHWQMKNNIKDVETLAKVVPLTEKDKADVTEVLKTFRMAITPYYASLIDPENPGLPGAPPGRTAPSGDPLRRERPGRPAARGFRQPGARPDAPLPGPRAAPRHAHLLDELPPLHAQAHRRRGRREHDRRAHRRGHRVHQEDADHPRRAHLRRRSPGAVRREARAHHPEDPRHPARRDHPHRHAHAGGHAPAHHRRPREHAQEVPPALRQHALQPPQGDHRRSRARPAASWPTPASRWATRACCCATSTTARCS